MTSGTPRRRAIRAQSTAVKPPPRITTRGPRGGALPALAPNRNPRPGRTPGRSSPGTSTRRGRWQPMASTTASWRAPRSSRVTSRPSRVAVFTSIRSARIAATSRRTTSRGNRKAGIASSGRPPHSSAASSNVTRWPSRHRWNAAARPAGPPPTTATVRPEGGHTGAGALAGAGVGASTDRSAAVRLRSQMATGFPRPSRPWRQTCSQGRVQTRPRTPGSSTSSTLIARARVGSSCCRARM